MGYDLKPGDVVDNRNASKDGKAIIGSNDDHIKYYKHRDKRIAQQLDTRHRDHRITFFTLHEDGTMKFHRDPDARHSLWQEMQRGELSHVKYWLSSDVDASPEAFLAFLIEARQLGWNMSEFQPGQGHAGLIAVKAIDNFFQSWPKMKPVIEAIQPEQPK